MFRLWVWISQKHHTSKSIESLAYVTLYFENNIIAHFNVNWLSPVKVRSTLIGGSKKMLIWNDLDPHEKIKIYDKGIELTQNSSIEDIRKTTVGYRTGDILSPKIENTEALQLEAQYFIDCINQNKEPHNNGESGLTVIKILEACDKSLKNQGQIIPFSKYEKQVS